MKFILTGQPMWDSLKQQLKQTGIHIACIETEEALDEVKAIKDTPRDEIFNAVWMPAGLIEQACALTTEPVLLLFLPEDRYIRNDFYRLSLKKQEKTFIRKRDTDISAMPKNLVRSWGPEWNVDNMETLDEIIISIIMDTAQAALNLEKIIITCTALEAIGFNPETKQYIIQKTTDETYEEISAEWLAWQAIMDKDFFHTLVMTAFSQPDPFKHPMFDIPIDKGEPFTDILKEE